uniref:Secreted protein n=1 Tax=Kalanchoe fedtschenkoi TaxID=63787 RepID=A0A7N1A3R3_KALFE
MCFFFLRKLVCTFCLVIRKLNESEPTMLKRRDMCWTVTWLVLYDQVVDPNTKYHVRYRGMRLPCLDSEPSIMW